MCERKWPWKLPCLLQRWAQSSKCVSKGVRNSPDRGAKNWGLPVSYPCRLNDFINIQEPKEILSVSQLHICIPFLSMSSSTWGFNRETWVIQSQICHKWLYPKRVYASYKTERTENYSLAWIPHLISLGRNHSNLPQECLKDMKVYLTLEELRSRKKR